MFMRRSAVAFAAVLLTACSSAAAVNVEPNVPQTTLATLIESTGVDVPGLSVEDVPEAALFLASVDQAMAGTAYQDEAFEDPETFLGTAVLFCELLESGLSAEDVLTAYLLALQSGGAADIPTDDVLLGGVILGAGVETLCPEFTPALGGVTN